MKILPASFEIEAFTQDMELIIEKAGRTAWKSDDRIEPGSAGPFIERLKGVRHESVLEHALITVRFIVDRGVSHEIVRHRIASFTQQSTRYCNYGKDKFGGEVSFIHPCFWAVNSPLYRNWEAQCKAAETVYLWMLRNGATPQEARSILPNSLATEIVVSMNPRSWRHFFHLRCDRSAHPQMREVAIPLWEAFAEKWPSLFNDVQFQ